MTPPRFGALAAAAAVLTLASACAASPAQVRETAEPTTDTSTADEASPYPLTVDNCGFPVTLEGPPERIVTIKSTSTELVLALGLGEKLVGTAFPDGELPEDLALPDPPPPELSDKAPGSEAVLAVEPDFILAGWESNLTDENAGDRADLESWGISTYVAPPACQEPDYQPNPLTFEHIFDYILETGALLGAPDAAEDIVAAQRETLETISAPNEQLSALWYSSASDIPFVGGGIGAPQLLMDTAGLRNINEDLPETWASVAWEAIADADPDVIVLVDSEWNTAEHKIDVMESHPVASEMSAVKHARYLTVPFPASEAGIRSVDAAASLAEQTVDLDS